MEVPRSGFVPGTARDGSEKGPRWSRRCRRGSAAPSRLAPGAVDSVVRLDRFPPSPRLRASDIMEPNLTYVYPHTRIQSLVSILRTTVHHAFPVVTENRGNEKEFMKGNQLISNNIKYKVKETAPEERWATGKRFPAARGDPVLVTPRRRGGPGWLV